MYDWKITLRKAVKVFLYASVPAGLVALLGVPELGLYAPVIAGLLVALENYIKNA